MSRIAIVLSVFLGLAATADESERSKRWLFYFGGVAATLDSSFEQTDRSTGLSYFIDSEGLLGLPSDVVVPSFGFLAGVGDRRFVAVTFTRFLRSTTAMLEQDLDLGGAFLEAGGSYTIRFNSNDFDASYATVISRDDRLRILGKIGVYALDLDLSVEAQGEIRLEQRAESGRFREDVSLVAPLPLVGVLFDYDIRERWQLFTSVEAIYLPVGDITGQALRTQIRARHHFNDTIGVGFGLSHFAITVVQRTDLRETEIKYDYDGFYAGMYFTF